MPQGVQSLAMSQQMAVTCLSSLWQVTFPSLLPRALDEWPDATG